MKLDFSLEDLNAFIVKAKAATYVGDGEKAESCRPGSHDLIFEKVPFFYRTVTLVAVTSSVRKWSITRESPSGR